MAGTSKTRITKLTSLNVQALREVAREEVERGDLILTATTAEWPETEALAALRRLDAYMAGLPTKGHPRASLHAVIRKLEKLVPSVLEGQTALTDEEIALEDGGIVAGLLLEEEETPTEYLSVQDVPDADDTPMKPVAPEADFLLDQNWSNLFEPTTSKPGSFGPFRCKGCGDVIGARDRERHFNSHKENRNMAKTENAKPAAAPKKPTAKDQGVPAVYLGANGNFKPGLDARLKSDLVAAILGIENKGALATFTKETAEKLIKARGWQGFVDTKQRVLEAKTAKADKAAADKAERVRIAAEAKAAKAGKADDAETQTIAEAAAADGDQVVPDPKPTAKPKTGNRNRK